MRLSEIRNILKAEVLCCEEKLECEVHSACGADLMSDVLAFPKDNTVLLTGLMTAQAVRTAEMSDAVAIIFVRGKKPNPEVLAIACENGLPVLATSYPLYEACGRLYVEGIRSSVVTENTGA